MIIDKLTEPRTHLESVDLTPNQKVHLWAVMARYGAKQGFSYKRFFDKGFRQWELQGIDNIKRTSSQNPGRSTLSWVSNVALNVFFTSTSVPSAWALRPLWVDSVLMIFGRGNG